MKPLYEILGGKVRDEAPILTMLAGGDQDAEVENAKEQADQGFVAFKVKIGALSPERDLERSRAARTLWRQGSHLCRCQPRILLDKALFFHRVPPKL